MNSISTEKVKQNYTERSNSYSFNMKALRKFVENNQDLPDNTPVLVERVTDIHFEDNVHNGETFKGWNVWLNEGFHYYNAKGFNEKMDEEIKNRLEGKEPRYPKIENPEEYKTPLTDDLKEQFYTPHYIGRSKEDFVLIYSHY